MDDAQPISALFIGGGNMARAILAGAAASGLDARFIVVEPDEAKHEGLPSPHATLAAGFADLCAQENQSGPGTGQVILAVKPQMLSKVAAQLTPILMSEAQAGGPTRVVISILAGMTSQKIHEALSGHARVVRTMPNTPAQVGMGMSAVAVGEGAKPGDESFARALLGSCGEVIELAEDLLDAFTALAGSGPAYVFYLAESMAKAGESLGFTTAQADRIARQTVLGSAHLLAGSPEISAEELRARVTSKKGTTQAATDMLDGADLNGIFRVALTAARDRGRELAGE
ncbi:MAG: pyrroline-5-carboxylate reductase [Phycisphaerales bacterium]|jgi:pyrroline-5-carboxylate reductase